MASLERIRTHGFRLWYERQLIECHAWLISCFLGIICTVSGLEVMGQHTSGSRLTGVMLAIAGAALSLLSWKRYRGMLAIAERLGERAICPGCQAYSKFRVVDSGPTPMPDGGDPEIDSLGDTIWLRAECRKCGRRWVL